MKASILKLVLGVGLVVVVQSLMYYGSAVGLFVFGLGGRGTLTLRTYRLGFFIFLISPFPFIISPPCWAYMDEIGSQSGFSEVNTRLVCSFTSDIPLAFLLKYMKLYRGGKEVMNTPN